MPEEEDISVLWHIYFKIMALKLDILVIPTYNTKTLGIADASTYLTDPPVVTSPTIEITPPGFNMVSLPFIPQDFNVFSSSTLRITSPLDELLPLPDGIYFLKYSIAPASTNYVERSIMRVDKIQEKFDNVFMRLDMMECDGAIKTQAKVDLSSAYFFISGAIAAANNCAIVESNKLYAQASRMLDQLIRKNCGCSGSNYLINF